MLHSASKQSLPFMIQYFNMKMNILYTFLQLRYSAGDISISYFVLALSTRRASSFTGERGQRCAENQWLYFVTCEIAAQNSEAIF